MSNGLDDGSAVQEHYVGWMHKASGQHIGEMTAVPPSNLRDAPSFVGGRVTIAHVVRAFPRIPLGSFRKSERALQTPHLLPLSHSLPPSADTSCALSSDPVFIISQLCLFSSGISFLYRSNQIHIFMSKALGFFDRSGLNVTGNVNAGNVTAFEVFFSSPVLFFSVLFFFSSCCRASVVKDKYNMMFLYVIF